MSKKYTHGRSDNNKNQINDIPLTNLLVNLRSNHFTGESEFQIGDVRRPITTWLTLSDSRLNSGPYGELMFSISYLPTAERLTVVIVKARKLKLNDDDSNKIPQNVFVKVNSCDTHTHIRTHTKYE